MSSDVFILLKNKATDAEFVISGGNEFQMQGATTLIVKPVYTSWSSLTEKYNCASQCS